MPCKFCPEPLPPNDSLLVVGGSAHAACAIRASLKRRTRATKQSITARVDADEAAQIAQLAATHGLKVAAWVRFRALTDTQAAVTAPGDMLRLARENVALQREVGRLRSFETLREGARSIGRKLAGVDLNALDVQKAIEADKAMQAKHGGSR